VSKSQLQGGADTPPRCWRAVDSAAVASFGSTHPGCSRRRLHGAWELAKVAHLSEPGSGREKGLAATSVLVTANLAGGPPCTGTPQPGSRCEGCPRTFRPPQLREPPPLLPPGTIGFGSAPRANSGSRQGCRFETLRLLLPLTASRAVRNLSILLCSAVTAELSELSRQGPPRTFACNLHGAGCSPARPGDPGDPSLPHPLQ
jgi:hypothetical protein